VNSIGRAAEYAADLLQYKTKSKTKKTSQAQDTQETSAGLVEERSISEQHWCDLPHAAVHGQCKELFITPRQSKSIKKEPF
jgi:hypothetical protein